MELNTLINAKNIQHDTNIYNKNDYELLKRLTKAAVDKKKYTPSTIDVTVKKMRKDKAYFKNLLHDLLSQPDYIIDFHPLKSSLQKLIGLDIKKNKKYMGIIERSIDILLNGSFDIENGRISDEIPTQSLLTIYKYICINFLVVCNGKKTLTTSDSYINQLNLLYSIQLHERHAVFVKNTGLYLQSGNKHFLYIPNTGYIFGGNFKYIQDDVSHRGLDCASFVFISSYYRQIKNIENFVIPSTSDVEKYYKINQLDIQNIKVSEQIKFLVKNYLFIDLKNLNYGDIIIWRTSCTQTGSNFGHAAIFKEWVHESKKICQVYEAVRRDDFSKEGILSSLIRLNWKNSTTYLLRRK